MRHLARIFPGLLAVLLILTAVPAVPVAAQDPAQHVEAMALRAHLQNLRTGSYTFWIGGNLGDPGEAVAQMPIGDTLDRWDLPRLNGDGHVTPEDLRRPTALNFWASWCPPCRLEFPDLTEIALAPDAHAFDVLFVNTSDSEDAALAFLEDQPEGIEVVFDKKNALARRAQSSILPTTLLIDRDGFVLAAHVGVVTPTIADFFDAVAADPGVGQFDPADWPDALPAVDLAPFDAADAMPLAVDQRALGTLTEDDFQHVYAFEGHQGDAVMVEITADSPSLDPFLVLIGPDGKRLAEAGDVDATRRASIAETLPEDGTYLVVATRFLGVEGFFGGDYSLIVTVAGSADAGAGQGIIGYGAAVNGRVSGMNPRELYSFEGHAGDVVTLRVTHAPGDVPLQIEILTPDKHRLGESPASVDGETALEDVALPADGDYLVVVKRERSRETENLDYTLTLDAAE